MNFALTAYPGMTSRVAAIALFRLKANVIHVIAGSAITGLPPDSGSHKIFIGIVATRLTLNIRRFLQFTYQFDSLAHHNRLNKSIT